MENKKLNILGLSLFGRQGASSRYRLYQYIPYLKKDGIECKVLPLINDRAYNILLGLKKVNKFLKPVIKSYLVISALFKRFFHILQARRYDVIFIQKDVLPSFYLFLLRKLNNNIIFDLDDALYENHSTIKPSFFSLDYIFFKLRKNNLVKMLKCAKAVTVTTPYLAEYVKKFNKNVHIITGPIDSSLYIPLKKDHRSKIVIGWIGSPVTTKYVQDISEVLIELQNKYSNIEFHLIGAKKFELKNVNIQFLDWSEETEIKLLSDFDIGIMPLTDDKWSKGKGGLKILQYFAMSLPVVCSPIGINNQLISQGKNGFGAKSAEDWIEYLDILINNEDLRKEMGKNGRKIIEEKYDLKKASGYLAEIIITELERKT
ncbi:MAG: glycosyltransferase family 4 protein [Candidatus Delongbacteria bacterium]|jgi:glycosyltransferase involved in cell wall biosynthesis|nr:glycosyltransferase family 4 protein [Candidatus Delongbacteria bacterium]